MWQLCDSLREYMDNESRGTWIMNGYVTVMWQLEWLCRMTWFYAWPLGRGTLIFFGFSTSGMGPFRGRYRRFYHSTYWMFIESRKEKYSIPFWADLEGSEAPFSRLVSFGLKRTRLLWETMVFWPRGWPCWAPISRNTCSLGQKAPFKGVRWPPWTWFYVILRFGRWAGVP